MTTNPLAGLIFRSPFGPIQEHMKTVEECASLVPPLFEALERGDHDRVTELRDDIFRLENRADEVKNQLRSHLPKSLFMPVDRRDLLDLLQSQDSIADTAQDIAGLVVLRGMSIPECLRGKVVPFARTTHEAVQQCGRVIGELDDLLEIGFRGSKEVAKVEGMIDRLAALEGETDDQGMELVRILFAHEDEMKPLRAVYWTRLVEMIGDLADYAEDVGDRLRLLIAR